MRANRWPTWPNPTSKRSASIRRPGRARGQRVEHVSDSFECGDEQLGIAAEADPDESVHLEMIAGDDEDALLVANALDQRGRADAMRVVDEGDRAGLRRHMRER